MPLAKLSIDLEARLATLDANLKQAVGLADNAAKQIQDRFDAAGSLLKGALRQVTAGLGVGLFASTIKSSIDAVDALNDVADATGTTVENASALEDIARRTGASLDTVQASLIKLNQGLKDTNPNSEAAQALNAIGLSVKELRALDPAEALLKVAIAFNGYADNGDKARVMQTLFGKGMADLAPLLKDLGEAGQLNATVTKAQAEEAEKFNHRLNELSKNAEDARRVLVSGFLPAVTKLFELFAHGVSGSLMDGLLGNTTQARLQADLKATSADISRTTDSIERMQTELSRNPGNSLLAGRIDKARDRLIDLQRQAADTSTKLKQLAGVMDGGGDGMGAGKPAPPDPIRPRIKPPAAKDPNAATAERAAEAARKQFEELLARIKERQAVAQQELETNEKLRASDAFRTEVLARLEKGTSKLTDQQKKQVQQALDGAVADMRAAEAQQERVKLTEAESRALAQITQARAQTVVDLGEEFRAIGLTGRELDQLKITRLEEAAAREEQAIAAAKLFDADSTTVAQQEDNLRLLREEIDQRKRNAATLDRLSTDQYAGATRGLKEYLAEIARSGDATEQAVKRSMSGLEDALTAFVTTGKADVKGLVDSILAEFVRIQVVRPMLNDIFGGGSGGVGGLLGLIGLAGGSGSGTVSGGSGLSLDGVSAGGSSGSSLYSLVGGRATGGPVDPGKAYWVGEQGPEIVRFGAAASVLNARDSMRAAGAAPAIHITQHLSVGEFVTPSQATQMARQARDAAVVATLDTLRRSGAKV